MLAKPAIGPPSNQMQLGPHFRLRPWKISGLVAGNARKKSKGGASAGAADTLLDMRVHSAVLHAFDLLIRCLYEQTYLCNESWKARMGRRVKRSSFYCHATWDVHRANLSDSLRGGAGGGGKKMDNYPATNSNARYVRSCSLRCTVDVCVSWRESAAPAVCAWPQAATSGPQLDKFWTCCSIGKLKTSPITVGSIRICMDLHGSAWDYARLYAVPWAARSHMKLHGNACRCIRPHMDPCIAMTATLRTSARPMQVDAAQYRLTQLDVPHMEMRADKASLRLSDASSFLPMQSKSQIWSFLNAYKGSTLKRPGNTVYMYVVPPTRWCAVHPTSKSANVNPEHQW
eukprot:366490-Chlamydomonas_euryale.AAC.41